MATHSYSDSCRIPAGVFNVVVKHTGTDMDRFWTLELLILTPEGKSALADMKDGIDNSRGQAIYSTMGDSVEELKERLEGLLTCVEKLNPALDPAYIAKMRGTGSRAFMDAMRNEAARAAMTTKKGRLKKGAF